MSQLRLFVIFALVSSCVGRSDSVAPPKVETIPVPSLEKDVESVAPAQFNKTPGNTEGTIKETPAISSKSTPEPAQSPAPTAAPTDAPTPTPTTPSTQAPTTPPPAPTTPPTPAPTTPPTPAPTPAPPKPGPVPAPDQGTWMYTDEKNVTCIVVQFAAQLNVSFSQMDKNNSSVIAHAILNIPVNGTQVTGNCNGTEQWILISWSSGVINSTVANSLRLNYVRNDTTKVYALKSLNVSLDSKMLVNISTPGDEVQFSHGMEWQTPLATSYRCSSLQLNLTKEVGVDAASLQLTGLQEEAYRSSHGKGFSAARECGGGDVPDAVPIAVGCALGGLVLIVLTAYLVARRQNAARGYLSM